MNNNIFTYCAILLMCIALCIYVIINTIERLPHSKVRRYYIFFILSIALSATFDLIWKVSSYSKIRFNYVFSYTVNTFYFIFVTLMAYYWFLYSEKVQGSKKTPLQRKISVTVFNVPYIIILFLIITSFYTHSIFYIKNGTYYRGNLYIISVIIPSIFIFYTSVKAMLRLYNPKYYALRKINLFVSLYAIILLASQTFQIISNGEIPASTIGSTVILFTIHESNLLYTVNKDILTGLPNRVTIERNLLTEFYSENSSKLFFIIFDVDGLKKINKKYGKIEGDNALKKIGEAINNALSDKYFVGRFKGDEFAVIGQYEHISDMNIIGNKVNIEIEKLNSTHLLEYPVSVSYGFSLKTNNTPSILDLIDNAEEQAHLKREHKEII